MMHHLSYKEFFRHHLFSICINGAKALQNTVYKGLGNLKYYNLLIGIGIIIKNYKNIKTVGELKLDHFCISLVGLL